MRYIHSTPPPPIYSDFWLKKMSTVYILFGIIKVPFSHIHFKGQYRQDQQGMESKC